MSTESTIPTSNPEKIDGWQGNWRRGERPEEYISISNRVQELEKFGFDLKVDISGEILERNNNIMRIAKTGILSNEELKELLFVNKAMIECLDIFEKKLDTEVVLPTDQDILYALQDKLQEFEQKKNGEEMVSSFKTASNETLCKWRILNQLFVAGSISLRKSFDKFGEEYDSRLIRKAFVVIKNYVESGVY